MWILEGIIYISWVGNRSQDRKCLFYNAYKDGMKYGSGTLIPSRIRVYWKCISRFYLLFENKVEIFFNNNLLLCFIYLSCFFLSLVFFSFSLFCSLWTLKFHVSFGFWKVLHLDLSESYISACLRVKEIWLGVVLPVIYLWERYSEGKTEVKIK